MHSHTNGATYTKIRTYSISPEINWKEGVESKNKNTYRSNLRNGYQY